MSSVNAINSNVSFGRAKKADKAEKQPKVSKHVQKRAMEKYGVDYMSLSPEAQKIIKKDINYEYAAIGISTIATAGLSMLFLRNQKIISGFTEALINSGKKVASNIPGLKNKIDPNIKDAKGLAGFAGDKINLLFHAKEIKAEEKAFGNLAQGVLDRINDVDDGIVNVNGIRRFIQKTMDNENAPESVKQFADSLQGKIKDLDGEIASDKLTDLEEFVQSSLAKANGAFNEDSKLGQFVNRIFGDKADVMKQKLADKGIKDGASVFDTILAYLASIFAGSKAADVADDATDLNNGEVTEEALIAHIEEKGSEAVLKGFGKQAVDMVKDIVSEGVNSL